MRYQAIIFDVDGTLEDSERLVIDALTAVLADLGYPPPDAETRELIMRSTTEETLRRLKVPDLDAAAESIGRHWLNMLDRAGLFPGVVELLHRLKAMGVRLGIATSRANQEVDADPNLTPILPLFEARACVEDTEAHKPDPAPIVHCLKRMNLRPEDALYVGDSPTDAQSAHAAGVDFALAEWGCRPGAHIPAEHYLVRPDDLIAIVENPNCRWLDWARELQFIGQAGVTYSPDPFDQERFARIREIAAEIMQAGTGMDIHRITDLFCSETGFQTPKLDTRAAIFDGDQILMVQERDGLWALPGGWVDANQTIAGNTLKEVREETGMDAEYVKLIALQDRNRHNRPIYAYGICKAFSLCRATGGGFQPNLETSQTGWFSLDALPPLAETKTTAAQIRMCFEARRDDWAVPVD